jgi:sugar transferase (PEP-CTERM system associated)
LAFVLLIRPHVDTFLTRYGMVTRIAIVGMGAEAQNLAEQISRRRESGQIVSCFVSGTTTQPFVRVGGSTGDVRTIPVIGTAQLLDFAASYRLKRILVATGDLGDNLPVDELLRCKAEGFDVLDGHTFLERMVGRIFLTDLSPRWLIFSDGFKRSAMVRLMKRVLDIAAAGSIVVLTAPLCVLVAAIIKLQDGGPVLYRQTRVGQRDTLFTVFKFRSMRVDAEATSGPKWADHNDPRVTRFGRWIRSTRIDEIPQAWNVLRGDMSFVGPRPERPEFVAQLTRAVPYYQYRHFTRPGITGWAQVNLPYTATIDDSRDKIEYDLYYLKNFTPLMDLFIIARTVKIILFGWGSR